MPNHTKKCCDKDARKSVKAFNFALTIDQVMDFCPVASVMKDDDITHMVPSDNAIFHFDKKLFKSENYGDKNGELRFYQNETSSMPHDKHDKIS